MTELTDKEILLWYAYGFNDELSGRSRLESDYEIQNIAYRIGAAHAELGDNMPRIDYMTDDETLKIIKNEYGKNNSSRDEMERGE
jgi:hypothetical protein